MGGVGAGEGSGMDGAVAHLYAGTRIEVSKCLVGSKIAFQIGDGPIVVSPAMYDLIRNASPAELETLLKTIRVKRLPSVKVDFSVPMVTTPIGPPPDWKPWRYPL